MCAEDAILINRHEVIKLLTDDSSAMEVEERSLADISTEILQQFPKAINVISQSHDQAISQFRAEFQDSLERFQLFAANLNLINNDHSSLDYRLRDADLLRSTVLRLLQDLISSLNEGIVLENSQLYCWST
jgi:hypothetical protein